jgi:beta-galactosidase
MEKFQPLTDGWLFTPDKKTDSLGAALPRFAHELACSIRVPGFWNSFPDEVGGDWGAYRHHDYPADWQTAEAGLYLLRFEVDIPEQPMMRQQLEFEGVLGLARVWLNGTFLGENRDPFLPFTFEVTDTLQAGGNELLVRVDPPPRDDHGDWLQPCGSWVGWFNRGIWQPVGLRSLPLTSIADVFVQPSVRQSRLVVDITIAPTADPSAACIDLEIFSGDECVLRFESLSVETSARAETVVRLERHWPDARCWSLEDPHLYVARVTLCVNSHSLHTSDVRFGFREFWIEGRQFVLNGQPLRLFGDSWHYMGLAQQNPAYARTWFEFAKSIGVNAIRTHAMPYPPFYFDIADEVGMLIIDESAVYGSAGTLAFDQPEFWEHCRDHMRRLVKRDRNHPAIIFWSACNETVWKGGEEIFEGLRSLAQAARSVDPTRFVSFDENDCDVGGAAPLHAGHYGTPEHWDRAWRRDRPLVVHEFSSLYHGGPEYVSPLAGEAGYADYHVRLQAAGEDAADMFDRLRSLGAASLTPWNLNWYCLFPWLASAESVPEELTAGGAPLERIGSGALTLNYGYLQNQPAWVPNDALEPLERSYRRRRFWLPTRPWQGFAGQTLRLNALVWNDTNQAVEAELVWQFYEDEEDPTEHRRQVSLGANSSITVPLELTLPVTMGEGECSLCMLVGGGEVDAEFWGCVIDEQSQPEPLRKVFVLGADSEELPAAFGGERITEQDLSRVAEHEAATLVLAAGARLRTLNEWVRDETLSDWLLQGGRLVVLKGAVAEDSASALTPICRPIKRAFVTSSEHPLVYALCDEDFFEWGPEGLVADRVMERPSGGLASAPLYVGENAAGLSQSPLIVCAHGAGHVIVSGLCLEERLEDTPAAGELCWRMGHLELAGAPGTHVQVAAESDDPLLDDLGITAEFDAGVMIVDARVAPDRKLIKQHLSRGGTLIVNGIVPETAEAWSFALGIDIHALADEQCNVVRTTSEGLMQNLTHWDLCWVDRDTAQPIVRHTLEVIDPLASVLAQTTATQWRGYQTAHEQKKVAMMLRRMAVFKGPRSAVVEVECGKGRVILNQLCLHEARDPFVPRAQRILSSWLDELGVVRDPKVSPLAPRVQTIARPGGFITQWAVLGPFAAVEGHPLDHVFIDEGQVRPIVGESIAGRFWEPRASAFAHLDLTTVFGDLPERDRVAYAALEVYSAQDRSVLLDAPDMIDLLTGADGGVKVWLNGEVVGRYDFVRELVMDCDRTPSVPLRQGWNSLLIKLHNPSGVWRFAARFQTASGAEVGDLQYRLPSAAPVVATEGG